MPKRRGGGLPEFTKGASLVTSTARIFSGKTALAQLILQHGPPSRLLLARAGSQGS